MGFYLLLIIIGLIFGVLIYALIVEFNKKTKDMEYTAIADPLKDKVFIEADKLNESLF